MDKFVKLAFVAGTGALAGGAMGAFAVERHLLKARRENDKLKRDLEAAEDRTKRLVDEEKWQKQHLATTFAGPLAQQWMQMQGMSNYEADWKKAAIGPLVEKAMHAQLLRAPSDYGFSTLDILESRDLTHIAGGDKLLRPGRFTITLQPVLKRVGNTNWNEESRFPLRQPDG